MALTSGESGDWGEARGGLGDARNSLFLDLVTL